MSKEVSCRLTRHGLRIFTLMDRERRTRGFSAEVHSTQRDDDETVIREQQSRKVADAFTSCMMSLRISASFNDCAVLPCGFVRMLP